MEIYYQGVEITEMVQTRKCIVHDGSGGRCDSMELEFENAAGWYSWGPAEDDQVFVTHNGYDSGVMFVNTVLPQDGKFRIMATALPCSARKKESRSFINQSIEKIMRTCAFASGMDFQIFGIDGNTMIPYTEQNNEGPGAFLYRILMLEGAALKCINGKYVAIGIEYAQAREVQQTIELLAQQEGAKYQKAGIMYKSVTVKTPYAKATAEDALVTDNHMHLIINDLPALDNVQAARWAHGKLLHLNRQSEIVTVMSEFNPGFSALSRIDIEGDTEANGEWLIEETEHDFINLTTSATMRRCIVTIQ